MANLMNAAAERRISEYIDLIGGVLGRKGRREAFAIHGLAMPSYHLLERGDGHLGALGVVNAMPVTNRAQSSMRISVNVDA